MRSNHRIKAVIEKYPAKTWRFEVLERLPPECSEQELLEAEQRHMDQLGTLDPERGFNVRPALAPVGSQANRLVEKAAARTSAGPTWQPAAQMQSAE